MIYLIIILFFVLLFFLFKNMKILKLSTTNLFTGELGTGKTALSLNRAIIQYRCNLFKFSIRYFINYCCYFVFKEKVIYWEERPLFYSSIPLYNFSYVELTNDILLRNVRINNKSIIFIDEISLIIDNMDFRDNATNEKLKYLIKLFRHYSHNGQLFINTQNIADNHYIIKRVINRYFYIHSKLRLPFVSILKVREMLYSEDGSVINSINSDLETDLKSVLIPNSIFKKYDNICYSILTDNKPFYRDIVCKIKNRSKLKTEKILKFKEENKKC